MGSTLGIIDLLRFRSSVLRGCCSLARGLSRLFSSCWRLLRRAPPYTRWARVAAVVVGRD